MSLHCLQLTIVFLFKYSSLAGCSEVEELEEETWLFISDLVLDVLSSFVLLYFTFPILLNSNEKLPCFVKAPRIYQRPLGKC